MSRGKPFKPGQSGNPKGRPKGIKDKRVKLRELLEGKSEALVEKALEMALAGDSAMMRLCLERLVPPVKEDPVIIEGLDAGTMTERGDKVLAAMGRGEVTPTQAANVLQAIAAQARITEVEELERRIAALEKQHGT